MHEIHDVIVRGGKIVLSNLPYADGQHIRVVVVPTSRLAEKRASIHEIRRVLKGGVERFDDPTGPTIPGTSWEMHNLLGH